MKLGTTAGDMLAGLTCCTADQTSALMVSLSEVTPTQFVCTFPLLRLLFITFICELERKGCMASIQCRRLKVAYYSKVSIQLEKCRMDLADI